MYWRLAPPMPVFSLGLGRIASNGGGQADVIALPEN